MVTRNIQYVWDDEKYDEPYRDPDLLEQLYWEDGLSLEDISDVLNCGSSTVHNWMKEHDIKRKKPDNEKLPAPRTPPHHCGDGGYEIIEHGYDGETYRTQHHRLVAVAEHGLDAVEGKYVHHKNKIPWDNRVDNLELMEPDEHTAHHRDQEPNDEKWHDKERLIAEYKEKDKTMKEIASEFGCDPVTIHNWLHRFGIETRTKGGKFA